MREEFERWYFRVVKGHPNNLARDESGGYKYLAAMYLGWEAAALIERVACAKFVREYEAGEDKFGKYRLLQNGIIADAMLLERERSNAEVTGSAPTDLQGGNES